MGVNVVEDEFETRTHMQVWRWVWGVRERVSVSATLNSHFNPAGATHCPTARGFEPLRAEPNGFLVHHLSHSVTLSSEPDCQRLSFLIPA